MSFLPRRVSGTVALVTSVTLLAKSKLMAALPLLMIALVTHSRVAEELQQSFILLIGTLA